MLCRPFSSFLVRFMVARSYWPSPSHLFAQHIQAVLRTRDPGGTADSGSRAQDPLFLAGALAGPRTSTRKRMKDVRSVVALAALLICALSTYAYSQITVGDLPTVSNRVLLTTCADIIRKGDVLPSNFVIGGGASQVWTVKTQKFLVGDRAIRYPNNLTPIATSRCLPRQQ